MKLVTFNKGAIERFRKAFANGGLAGAGHTHDDDNHAIKPVARKTLDGLAAQSAAARQCGRVLVSVGDMCRCCVASRAGLPVSRYDFTRNKSSSISLFGLAPNSDATT